MYTDYTMCIYAVLIQKLLRPCGNELVHLTKVILYTEGDDRRIFFLPYSITKTKHCNRSNLTWKEACGLLKYLCFISLYKNALVNGTVRINKSKWIIYHQHHHLRKKTLTLHISYIKYFMLKTIILKRHTYTFMFCVSILLNSHSLQQNIHRNYKVTKFLISTWLPWSTGQIHDRSIKII